VPRRTSSSRRGDENASSVALVDRSPAWESSHGPAGPADGHPGITNLPDIVRTPCAHAGANPQRENKKDLSRSFRSGRPLLALRLDDDLHTPVRSAALD
jgi:hypothetical protein